MALLTKRTLKSILIWRRKQWFLLWNNDAVMKKWLNVVAKGCAPPYKNFEREVSEMLLELEAWKRSLAISTILSPKDQLQLGVSMIWPHNQSAFQEHSWVYMADGTEERKRQQTNPPALHWQIMTTNGRIRSETRISPREPNVDNITAHGQSEIRHGIIGIR
jgi:hypothetical protein